MRKIKLIETEDGSHSLYVPELNETYHSFHGALQESEHVFIKSGLQYLLEKETTSQINIFEVGFGTGLNALLTLRLALSKPDVFFSYTTIEPFPLAEEIIDSLNYPQILKDDSFSEHFEKLHNAGWDDFHSIIPNFKIKKIKTTLQELPPEKNFHVIYFDAFAPNKQQELWTDHMMQKCYDLLLPGGILSTYCAQGQFKRNLKSAGFQVETIPGPPGKKEMVRAQKPS
jgi:tRNA U34 5-methylaminomethyl-2-thiouridine-forming methyltransferase MnmC